MKGALSLVLVLSVVAGAAFAGYPSSYKKYLGSLREWTRHKQWYSPKTMQAEMLWHATYFSPDFRRMYTKEIIKRKYMDPVEAAQFVAQQEREQAASDAFFIGLYTIKAYREFSMGEESFWEAVLIPESGEEIKAIGVEKIDVKPLEKILFPYLGRWSKGYRVRFPKVDAGQTFTLVLRSVIGTTELKWNLDADAKHSLESLEAPFQGEGE
ncbi:MAG: hypothetical protein Q8P84_05195 [Deltaproteobacteria bacterium]|nr:hypothetical protein [Deltaproteobacteria bacterium]